MPSDDGERRSSHRMTRIPELRKRVRGLEGFGSDLGRLRILVLWYILYLNALLYPAYVISTSLGADVHYLISSTFSFGFFWFQLSVPCVQPMWPIYSTNTLRLTYIHSIRPSWLSYLSICITCLFIPLPSESFKNNIYYSAPVHLSESGWGGNSGVDRRWYLNDREINHNCGRERDRETGCWKGHGLVFILD